MRTDNFIIVLFIVPVLITSGITSQPWAVTWELGFVIGCNVRKSNAASFPL
jgi:hypothetical protein